MLPTDKYENGYVDTYRALARTLPHNAAVCELGVRHGGSLELWRELWLAASVIVGVDISAQSHWPLGTVKVIADQQDPTLPSRLRVIQPLGYDLIVDDASHLGQATYKSFQHLWPLIRPGGYYVIEDWCVGFDTYPNFDDSMLAMAMMLLQKFSRPKTDVHFITYSYGLIVVRKKDKLEEDSRQHEAGDGDGDTQKAAHDPAPDHKDPPAKEKRTKAHSVQGRCTAPADGRGPG